MLPIMDSYGHCEFCCVEVLLYIDDSTTTLLYVKIPRKCNASHTVC